VTWQIFQGHVLDALRAMPSASVHCIVTSPPYWGLRKYEGVEPVEWDTVEYGPMPGLPWITIPAQEACLGLEATPEAYVGHIVEVCRQLRRVLRLDGTMWLNLGDCYNGQNARKPSIKENGTLSYRAGGNAIRFPGLKSKDLCGLPWRVFFALQADGWFGRRDVIWEKPNPMPESTRDRPTTAHEYLFLMTKSPKYFYDAAAIAENVTGGAHARGNGVNPKALKIPSGWDVTPGAHGSIKRSAPRSRQNESFSAAVKGLVSSRNKRSVWRIPTAPFPEAHFATFPPKLVEPCILAGTSAHGACEACGAPWRRVTAKGAADMAWQRACGANADGGYTGEATKDFEAAGAQDASAVKARILAGMRETVTTGWEPTCECGAGVVPATVLDPFGGSGTTVMVALRLGRSGLAIEQSETYCAMARRRVEDDCPLLNAGMRSKE
jgi:DNA modification methylase